MWKVETGLGPLLSEAVVLWKVSDGVGDQSLGLHLLFWWQTWWSLRERGECEDAWGPYSGRTGLPELPALPHRGKILFCVQSLAEKDSSALFLVLCAGGGARTWGPGPNSVVSPILMGFPFKGLCHSLKQETVTTPALHAGNGVCGCACPCTWEDSREALLVTLQLKEHNVLNKNHTTTV